MMKSKVLNVLIMYLRYPNWQMALLYLKKTFSFIPHAISFINNFSRASGLTLNVSKCEILPLHTINDKYIMNSPVKSSVKYKYLLLERQNLHFSSRLKKTKAVLNCWLQRDLSIYGRALLSKADGLSRFVYHCMLKILTARILIICSSLLFGKINPKDLKRFLTNKKAEGGLEMLYFEYMNKTFKINWLKRCLITPNSLWNHIPHSLFNQIGGLKFLLTCDYNICKIPLKLSTFPQQALLAWKMCYCHNFSPHTSFIWNNGNITASNKSVFLTNLFNRDINHLIKMFDNSGNILTCQLTVFRYNLGNLIQSLKLFL